MRLLVKSRDIWLPYLKTRGPWAVPTERIEDATKGPRVYKYRICH